MRINTKFNMGSSVFMILHNKAIYEGVVVGIKVKAEPCKRGICTRVLTKITYDVQTEERGKKIVLHDVIEKKLFTTPQHLLDDLEDKVVYRPKVFKTQCLYII